MPTEVTAYEVRIYGGPNGYQGNRAQITLYTAQDKAAGYLRFKDPDQEINEDAQRGDAVQMHLPLAALGEVLTLLQTEAEVTIHLASGRGFFTIGKQQVGGVPEKKRISITPPPPRGR